MGDKSLIQRIYEVVEGRRIIEVSVDMGSIRVGMIEKIGTTDAPLYQFIEVEDTSKVDLRNLLRPDWEAYLEEPKTILCEIRGCNATAAFEGWYRVVDPVLGVPTGLIRRAQVCSVHKENLIGGNKDGQV